MGDLNEIRVKLGLDKTGFDSGLKRAGEAVRKFAAFFGVTASAAFLSRIIGDVGELAKEVATLRAESTTARDVFDRMAGGIENIGDTAELTASQLEKLRKASGMFSAEQLDQLAKGVTWWGKVKDGVSQAVGKTTAFAVAASSAFFGLGSSMISGGGEEAAYRGRLVDSDRKVGEALRNERERLKAIEDQNAELESRRAMFAEEDVYIQKMVEAEQTRLDIERERVRLKISELEIDRKNAEQRLRDRSGFTLAELAGLTSGGPGALKANQAALKIQDVMERARMARLEEFGAEPMTPQQERMAGLRKARGIAGPMSADDLTKEEIRLRDELEPLISSERDPVPEIKALNAQMAQLLEMAKTQGLVVQPRMAK